MLSIDGYDRIHKMRNGAGFAVFSARDVHSSAEVQLAAFTLKDLPVDEFEGLLRRYDQIKKMSSHHFPRIHDVLHPAESTGYRRIVVSAPPMGTPLKNWISRRGCNLKEMLKLALALAFLVKNLHEKEFYLCNSTTADIFYLAGSDALCFRDIPSIFKNRRPLMVTELSLDQSKWIEELAPFLSPEQTGRMGSRPGPCSDFYTLGIFFYEMLTGAPPFPGPDAAKALHAHLALPPVAPAVKDRRIPVVLSDIVMRLLAKNPDRRYRSAFGLIADLKRCLRQFDAKGEIAPFGLGREDISEVLKLPSQLYGRTQELEMLQGAYHDIRRGGTIFCMIAGDAGIGKSRLASKFKSMVRKMGGYFISGKYDQYQRDIPYGAIVRALSEMIQLVLKQDPAEIEDWKNAFLSALKGNGKVIAEVIPEIEILIGEQPDVAHLPPAETRDRFGLIFMDFLTALCSRGHPVVMCLDDLQWADAGSLRFIQMLCAHRLSCFLLLGLYRNDGKTSFRPLEETLEHIRRKILIRMIRLTPLDYQDLFDFIRDTLERTDIDQLVSMLLEKTGGNPFFFCRFMESIAAEKLLFYDFGSGAWQWRIKGIKAKPGTQNVIALLTEKLHSLSSAAVETLQIAACSGTTFDLPFMEAVGKKGTGAVRRHLSEAEEHGFIAGIGSAANSDKKNMDNLAETLYQFQHDNIRQAVISQIPPSLQKMIHLKIGRSMRHPRHGVPPDKLFDMVNHLNAGRELISAEEEIEDLCRLNLTAGKRAKAANAYTQAMKYFKIGILLLKEDSWRYNYRLTYELYIESAESACLNGDFAVMGDQLDRLDSHTPHLLDQIRIYEVKILADISQNKPASVLKTALSALRRLGIKLPGQPTKLRAFMALLETRLMLLGKNSHAILNLPNMTDPYQLAAMRILCKSYPIFFSVPMLYPLIISRLIRLTLRYGKAPESIVGFADYGIALCSLGRIDAGYKYANFGLTLLEHTRFLEYEPYVRSSYNAFVRHWKEPLAETLFELLAAYRLALKNGKLDAAGFCLFMHDAHALFLGSKLGSLEKKMRRHHKEIQRTNQQVTLRLHAIVWQAALNMLGENSDPCRLIGEAYNEKEMLPMHVRAEEKNMLWLFHYTKTALNFSFGRNMQAAEHLPFVQAYMPSVQASAGVSSFCYYDSMVRLAAFSKATPLRQKLILIKVAANQKKMKKWSHCAPVNHRHRYELVRAERFRVLKKNSLAMEAYDKAIAYAAQNNFLHDLSLANERAALFYLSLKRTKIARLYLQESLAAAHRYGAAARCDFLKATYAELLTMPSLKAAVPEVLPFDFMAILHASQAISKKIVLKELLTTLMNILMETAGASRILFISALNENLSIEATADVNDEHSPRIVSKSIAAAGDDVLMSAIHYVRRTAKHLLIHNTQTDRDILSTRYFQIFSPKSILCLPVVRRSKLLAILYFENNITTGAFTPQQIEMLNVLSAQTAISFENASLYSDLARNEKELRQTVQRRDELKRIINRSPAIAVLFRKRPLFGIEFISENIRTFGYEPDHFYSGKVCYQRLIHPNDRQRVIAEISRYADATRPHAFHQEYRLMDQKGQVRWLEDRKWPRCDELGRITHYQGILMDITQRKLAAEKIEAYQARLRHLSAEVILAEERERRRIAMGMHDGIGHALALAKIKLKRVQTSTGINTRVIAEAEALIDTSIKETRSLTFELSPSILWDFGLEAAVTWLTREVTATHGIPIAFTENMDPKILPEGQRVLIFQSIRELMFNMVKHAKATHATVTIDYTDVALRIEIKDNGVGFDPDRLEAAARNGGGFGLFSIRERLRALGGIFEMQSTPGKGARFIIQMPFKGV